jgi:hypothetical protein
VKARNGSLVLELAEIACSAQHAWLAPRLHWVGALLAHFLSVLIGNENVPNPGRCPLQATSTLP